MLISCIEKLSPTKFRDRSNEENGRTINHSRTYTGPECPCGTIVGRESKLSSYVVVNNIQLNNYSGRWDVWLTCTRGRNYCLQWDLHGQAKETETIL